MDLEDPELPVGDFLISFNKEPIGTISGVQKPNLDKTNIWDQKNNKNINKTNIWAQKSNKTLIKPTSGSQQAIKP